MSLSVFTGPVQKASRFFMGPTWGDSAAMTACPNAHSKRTPFVALRHVHAKLLYGGGMRGCLRVYDGIPAGAAECRRDLAVDSRGEVPTKIRV